MAVRFEEAHIDKLGPNCRGWNRLMAPCLVRRLGLRGTKQNEVWAGKPVNMASKLSSLAGPNEVVASARVFRSLRRSF